MNMTHKSALLFVASTLVISGCSKSGDNGSPAPASPAAQYGAYGQNTNTGSFGFWQLDRVGSNAADASNIVHLATGPNAGRVISESIRIDQMNIEMTGFPDDLVHPYRGAYQLNGQTLVLNTSLINNGQPNSGMMNPALAPQTALPNAIPGENLTMTVVNANELTLGVRHFHRITQAQFELFRSQVSAVNLAARGGAQTGTATADASFEIPSTVSAAQKEKRIEEDRVFPDVALPQDWSGELAATPKSGFEMHLAGTRRADEVYQTASVACGANSSKGLVVRFATSGSTGLVQGTFQIDRQLWQAAKADRKSIHHLLIQPTAFDQPIRISERMKSGEAPFEKWAYSAVDASGAAIVNPSANGPGCKVDAKITNGELRAQVRCESVPSEFLIAGAGALHDLGIVTLQFACPIKTSIPTL